MDRIGSDELSEWLAFESLYGLPDVYFMTGQVCAVLAGVLGGTQKPATPADFVPYFKAMRPRQTTSDHAAAFRAMAESGMGKGKPKGVL